RRRLAGLSGSRRSDRELRRGQSENQGIRLRGVHRRLCDRRCQPAVSRSHRGRAQRRQQNQKGNRFGTQRQLRDGAAQRYFLSSAHTEKLLNWKTTVYDHDDSKKEKLRREALDHARLDTLAIRAGYQRTHEGEHSEAMFLTSSYVFDNAAQAAARFAGSEGGNVYSRYTNPTVRTFEERIAALEGGEMAVATASGMAAILSVCCALLKAGDHVVCSRSVFGTTTVVFSKYLAKFGVQTSFVALSDNAAWEAAIQPNTKLLFLETPSNPMNEVADLAALSALAKARGVLLVVD